MKALRVSKGPGNRTVTVRCPYCRRLHVHGWPREYAGEHPGNRLSHCVKPELWGSYDIVVEAT